eukprot:Hpha_TRINITY_DN33530_c0_g1::TRINITY_DN33530_c0_g1_i1::g.171087::m.171087
MDGADREFIKNLVQVLQSEGGRLKTSEIPGFIPGIKKVLRGRKITSICLDHPSVFIVEVGKPGRQRHGAPLTVVTQKEGVDLSGVVVLSLSPTFDPASLVAPPEPSGDHLCRFCSSGFSSRNKLYRHLELCEKREARLPPPEAKPAGFHLRVPGKREAADLCCRLRQIISAEWRPPDSEKGRYSPAPLQWVMVQRKVRPAVREWVRTLPMAAGEAALPVYSDEWYTAALRKLVVFVRERPEEFVLTEGAQGPLLALTEVSVSRVAEDQVRRDAVSKAEQARAEAKAAWRRQYHARWCWTAGAFAAAVAGGTLVTGVLWKKRFAPAGGLGAALLCLLGTRSSTSEVPLDKESSRKRWQELPVDGGESDKRQNNVRGRFLRWMRAKVGDTRVERREQLEWAAEAGEVKRLRRLLAAGVDLDAVDNYGRTALFIACFHGHLEAVRFLLSTGADPAIAAHGGLIPFNATRDEAILEALEEAGGVPTPDPPPAEGPGAGVVVGPPLELSTGPAYVVDFAVAEDFVQRIRGLWETLPVAEVARDASNERRYYCDASGWVRDGLRPALEQTSVRTPLPLFRFLYYSKPGQWLAPHRDLYHTDPVNGTRSTHTLILYLNDCPEGGDTALLPVLDADATPIRTVAPRRARLLLFPHQQCSSPQSES